ncbi:MAG: EscN/YscN/HrcN family type III secretion system ATPase, partial [Firmicutes bacterium]|nr:EscN/YscN/HrcN family type III secretion system ATPase [Bacillota bacterium]
MGKITQIVGLTLEANGPASNLGDLCWVSPRQGDAIPCEVVGFRENRVLLMPLGDLAGIGPGSLVTGTGRSLRVGVGQGLLGRILDGLGKPIDGGDPPAVEEFYSINGNIPS